MLKNSSGLKPKGVAVLLEPYEYKSESKLVIPDEARERMAALESRGLVIEVGPCAWADESTPRAKAGDRVLYAKLTGVQVKGTADGKLYHIVNDRDIFCQIEVES